MIWDMTVGEGESAIAVAPPPRTRLEGTEQQEAFWEELREGTGNVVLEARAGTGKSTSCREGMWRLIEAKPGLAIRYCCFNKKIADEFAVKAPPGVEVGTMHRFGLQSLQRAFGSTIEKNKTYLLMDDLGGADLKRYLRKSVSMLVGLAKNHNASGLPDDAMDDYRLLQELGVRFDVQFFGQTEKVTALALRCLQKSLEVTSLVDFDDMLWLCVRHGVSFPAVDLLFIDEAQDLNGTQHAMAERMAEGGRTVVVGDPFQSIYAFRGADAESMAKLTERLGATILPLTVSFRCPKSHVQHARTLVPDFEAAPDAIEGSWDYAADPSRVETVGPGDLILCRTNAPIISACLRAIRRKVPATVRGRSIGDSILAVLGRLDSHRTVAELLLQLDRWKSREIARLTERDGTEDLVEQTQDKAACLEAIAGSCDFPSEVPGLIGALFSDEDTARMATFSSVHRAKGSEAKSVLYLDIPYSEKRDKTRPPQDWESHQRRNLRYVAFTRSLDSMTLVPH